MYLEKQRWCQIQIHVSFKQCIIIEIDEHGHISYHVQDEQRRMSQIILYLLKTYKFDVIQVFRVNVGSLKNKSNKQQEYVAKLLEHCTTRNSSDGLTDEHGNVLIKSGSGVHYTFVDYKEDQKHVVAARKRIHSVGRPKATYASGADHEYSLFNDVNVLHSPAYGVDLQKINK